MQREEILLAAAAVGCFALKYVDDTYRGMGGMLSHNFVETCPYEEDHPGCISFDTWAASHVALFAYITKRRPQHAHIWFACGIIWEFAEYCLSKRHSRFWRESRTEQTMDALVWNVLGIMVGLQFADGVA